MSKKITVTAKITAGTHPTHGAIIAGEEYIIDEAEFAEELFTRPDGWLPPWERPVSEPVGANNHSPALDPYHHEDTPAPAGKKGR